MRSVQRCPEVPVGHDAATHRVQNYDVYAALGKQVIANQRRVRAGVAEFAATSASGVLAARCPVPIRFVVREASALERLTEEAAKVSVGREENMHARVDNWRAGSIRVFYHPNHPSRLRRLGRACWASAR